MQLRRDKRGSIAINFTLALIPITLAVGGAVDYSVANRIKAELDAAADAAALSAVSKTGVRERDADRVGPVPDGDLHLRHDNNDQCTDSNGALSGVNSVITTPGDGSVAATPQKSYSWCRTVWPTPIIPAPARRQRPAAAASSRTTFHTARR